MIEFLQINLRKYDSRILVWMSVVQENTESAWRQVENHDI